MKAKRKDLSIEQHDVPGILANASDRNQLEGLLAKSWGNASELLEESMKRVDRLLLGRDRSGKIVGFTSWRIKSYEVGGFAAVYVGIGVIDANEQGQGVGKVVIYGGVKKAWQELSESFPNEDKYVWTTTISPIAYLGLYRRFPTMFSPDPNGNFDATILSLLPFFKKELGAGDCNKDKYPFIVRSISLKRYIAPMKNHLIQVLQNEDIPLFQNTRVCETAGDRIILVFKV